MQTISPHGDERSGLLARHDLEDGIVLRRLDLEDMEPGLTEDSETLRAGGACAYGDGGGGGGGGGV